MTEDSFHHSLDDALARANERIGNRAPDWGMNYGLNDLWSEVTPGLWVGGTHDWDTVDVARKSERGIEFDVQPAEITTDEFDAVITLYAWARPVDWGVEELRWGIMDGRITDVDPAVLAETVGWGFSRWRAGKKVLVRCQAGLNRSSLITSLILMRAGYTPSEAIALIRTGRSSHCLFNGSFVAYLDTPDAARAAGATNV